MAIVELPKYSRHTAYVDAGFERCRDRDGGPDVNEYAQQDRDRCRVERRRRGHPLTPMATLTELPALVVLDRLPVPVVAIDGAGAIILANNPFAEMLGYTTEAVEAMTFDDIFDGLPAVPSATSTVRAHAEQIVMLKHADGFAVRAKMSQSALLRANDPLTLTTFQDLTEQLWVDDS